MEKYILGREVGRGSYATVYTVRDAKTKERLVLKKISLRDLSAKDQEASKQEVDLLKRLQHPFIVGYRESFFDAKGRYLNIIMTYCDGGDLASRVRAANGKHFSEDQVLIWFCQIALALDFVHEQRILHRDLKSQNVFLTKNGTVQLGDFGIARILDSTCALAHTAIGTPLYLSPEVCQNKPYSYKSDIWALGCLLFEMSTLRHAFDARNLNGLIMKIVRGVIPPLPTRYSQQLSTLVRKMLSKSPTSRPRVSQILKLRMTREKIQEHIIPRFLSESSSASESLWSQLTRLGFDLTPISPPPSPSRKLEIQRALEILKEEKEAESRAKSALEAARGRVELRKCVKKPKSRESDRRNAMEDRTRAKLSAAEKRKRENVEKIRMKAREAAARRVEWAKKKKEVERKKEIVKEKDEEVAAVRALDEGKSDSESEDEDRRKVGEKQKYSESKDVEKIKEERILWEKRVSDIQKEIDDIHGEEGGERVEVKRKQQQKEVDDSQFLSAKEKVMREKLRRKQEEEEKRNKELARARGEYFKQRQAADAKKKADYTSDMFPSSSQNRMNAADPFGSQIEDDEAVDEEVVECEAELHRRSIRVKDLEKTIAGMTTKGKIREAEDGNWDDGGGWEEDDTVKDEDDSDVGVSGGLHERYRLLREKCVSDLGDAMFTRAYSFLKNYYADEELMKAEEESEGLLKRQMGMLLGKQLEVWPFLDQLVFMEGFLPHR